MNASASFTAIQAARRSLFWRIHFWAALIATPFALLAAVTGLIYVFTPQIEQSRYGALDQVAVSGERRSLDDAVATALAAMPDHSDVRAVIPAQVAQQSTKVIIDLPDGKSTTVYVNPYNAAVLGSLPDAQRFNAWAKKLHSSLLQGEGWRWMIELAASWLLVMLITGIYLWWPRSNLSALPNIHVKGRNAWKQWHAFAGVLLSAITFTMLFTGITWSKYAGTQVRQLRDITGQAPPQVPRDLLSSYLPGKSTLSWQQAWDVARELAPDVMMQLTPPRDAQGVWRISSADRRQPARKFDLVLDAYSGKPLYYAGWNKQTAFSKATAIGIPFHRGELGVWNQALVLLFGAGVLFSLVSGWVMYFKRRRAGLLGLPPIALGVLRTVPVVAWLVAVALLVLLPMLAVSAAMVLMVEFYLYRSSPATA